MDTVAHLWKCTKTLAKENNPKANEIRNHYVQCCRDLGDLVELPNQFFGQNSMCKYCGTLWNSVDPTVRIAKGKNPSASIRKLIRRSQKKKSNLSTLHKKLIDRSKKNQSNKLIITCSCCSKKSTVSLNKVKKEKVKKPSVIAQDKELNLKKKKKKKRDKTAGLIIPISKAPDVNYMDNSIKKTSKNLTSVAVTAKKINFLLKAKRIINSTNESSDNKTGLCSLLTEH
ncbi:hypothetical protein HCN44_002645 [Aphidius gifuensis]|uniref:Uncharacterized protein n=1 Tax=Aphidius gifuensis TaxID=684658 RepID=A0A835CRC0_APHGI|nr:uncharacterized protein LOC122854546 [Aphidius gifuensis]KAF7991083.1 hypothetical protein HCN44_002645 [Aphidius gifuensis]